MSIESTTIKSLIILPFRIHQEAKISDSGLGEGLADALAARLFGVEGVNIRPTSSVGGQLLKETDSFKLGKSLDVDYILEGSIFPAKDRTRFTVQLLDIRQRRVEWGAHFDERETDVFLLEDKVSERIAKAVLPYLELTDHQPITDAVPAQPTGEIAEEEILPPEEAPTLTLPLEKSPPWTASRSLLIPLLIVAALLAGFFLWLQSGGERQLRLNGKAPTIVILPFQQSEASAVDNSLGTGLAESLSGNLGNIQGLFVLSASAGQDAARSGLTPPQIARSLNVNYLLRGNLFHIGDHEEIKADFELVETESGNVLWKKNAGVKGDDINGLQTQILEAILQTLAIEVTDSEKEKISRRNTNNGLAYEFYLIGRYQMAARSPDGLSRAIAAFSQALEKDANFALAYVGLADAHALRNLYENPPPADAYEKAKDNVMRALALDESLAEAHATLAYILFYAERKPIESEREFRRAIELNPSYATTHHWFAMTLSATGKHREALAEIELAQKLDPRSSIVSTAKGMIHFYARQYREGLNECEKSLASDNGFVPAHKIIRWIAQTSNNYQGALDAFQKERSFGGSIDAPGWLVIESQVESTGGNFDKARALLEKALASETVRENPKAFAYEIALAYAALGDREKAFEWLETAERVGNHSFNFLKVEPRFDKYRNEERFKALLKKLANSDQ